MSTESCGRCGAPAPEALLRNVSLHVDGSEVDAQIICPDCFSDWIAHYQEQMAGDMPGADETGDESDAIDDDALSEAVRAAQQHIEGEERQSATAATPPERQHEESVESVGGDEIHEVSSGSATDGGVDVDPGGETDAAEDDEDDGGLLPG